jgi:ubiquinone biosynthesis protein
MIAVLRNLFRLLWIAVTLARKDALFVLEQMQVVPGVVFFARLVRRRGIAGRPGQRLAEGLREAGPSFIKLGQALATRSDLVGEEIAADLSQLQDHLPPFEWSRARQVVENEFRCPLESMFASFDQTPIAAASISQVHLAVTTDGREVAVKVLRPNIEDAFRRDLDLFFWLATVIEATRPELRRFRPLQTVRMLADSVTLEMDLRFEAAAAAELRRNFENDPTFHIPLVDWERTGQRVLTIERVSGIRIDNRLALVEAGHDPDDIMQKAGNAFFKQVFRDGFFHADLHPGNLFVRADGSVAAIDFGIMGRLDRKTRRHLAELLIAFLKRDYRRAAEVHLEAGWIPPSQSVEWFAQACCSVAEPILDRPQNEISIGRLLGQLFQVSRTFQMEAQINLLLLQKTMLVAEGISRRLNPNANIWALARPLAEDIMGDLLGPGARVREGFGDLSAAALKVPRLIDRLEVFVETVGGGGLRLHPETARQLRDAGRTHVSIPLLWLAVAVIAVLMALGL